MLLATPNEAGFRISHVRDCVKDLKVAKRPLPGCDYMFEAHGRVVGVEVKWSMSDLLDSLRVEGENGGPRLAVEVRKLSAFADIPFLLVPPLRNRGDGKLLRDDGVVSGWDYNSVKGILTDIQLAGVFVDEWDGDLAQRLAQLYFVISQSEHSWIEQRGRPDYVNLDRIHREAVWAVCAFDHWGPKSVTQGLKGLSLKRLAGMGVKELVKLPGVGPKMAKSLVDGMEEIF